MFTQAEFEAEFGPKLGTTHRWGGFLTIAGRLSRLKDRLGKEGRPVFIGETGCVRHENDFAGNGCSTQVWDWIVKKSAGEGFSIDIDPNNANLARRVCPNIKVIRNDSIHMLSHPELDSAIRKLDLLYLDSKDHNPPYALSELHHAGELAACYERLPSGCMIAVDDCNADDTGKHTHVLKFFDRLEIHPLLKSYIHIWVKP